MPIPVTDATQEFDTSLVAAIAAFADAAATLADRRRAAASARIASAGRFDLAFEGLNFLVHAGNLLASRLHDEAPDPDLARGIAYVHAIAIAMTSDLGVAKEVAEALADVLAEMTPTADAPAERIEVVVEDQAAS